MSDLAELDLLTVSKLISSRKISPTEYMRCLIDRIETYDGKINSCLLLLSERALDEAKVATETTPDGPLHGIPYGLKDIIDARGLPTTAQSKILSNNIAIKDATVTRKISQAGGILLAKMATHEFALGGPSFDLAAPPARNPWNLNCYPGGSSSGSGAAVAARFLPAAIGTDTGGSVRNPASACSIVGIKATYGRVSTFGVFPLSQSLDHVGPLTRTVADNALMLQIMAGYDSADPSSSRQEVPNFSADLGRGIKDLRIGVLNHFHCRDMHASRETCLALEEAISVLQKLGAKIFEVETEALQDYATTNRIILLSEAYSIHRRWLSMKPEKYGQLFKERILPGAFLPAHAYVDAFRRKQQLSKSLDNLIRGFDVIIAASNMDAPFKIDDPKEITLKYPRQARTPFNVTGHPAIAIPIGFDAEDLPLAMQVVGNYFDETMVYRVAHAYEQETGWQLRSPTFQQPLE